MKEVINVIFKSFPELINPEHEFSEIFAEIAKIYEPSTKSEGGKENKN